MPTSNKLTDSFRTKSERGATETHTIDTLAERLLITVEAAHELISSGVLEPIGGDDTGEKLKFQSDDLDAIRDAVVSSTEEEVDEQVTDPKQKTFATVRALSLLQMASRESANQFAKARATEIRLARISVHHNVFLDATGNVAAITEKGKAPANIKFGLATEIVKIGGRLLRSPGQLTIAGKAASKLPLTAGQVYARNSAVVGGVGSAIGAAKAGLDDDPETSVLGGALKGAAVGAGVGAAGTFAGRAALDALAKNRNRLTPLGSGPRPALPPSQSSAERIMEQLRKKKAQATGWASEQAGEFRRGWNGQA